MYAGDVERDITLGNHLITAWESLNLDEDQKLYRLAFHHYCTPQLRRVTALVDFGTIGA